MLLEKPVPAVGSILPAEFLLQFIHSEPHDLFMMVLRCCKHNGCGLQSQTAGFESWASYLLCDPGLITEFLCLSIQMYKMGVIIILLYRGRVN